MTTRSRYNPFRRSSIVVALLLAASFMGFVSSRPGPASAAAPRVRLCSAVGLYGMCRDFTGNVPDLRAYAAGGAAEPTWDNITSSVSAYEASVALYELPNYQGRCETIPVKTKDYDLRDNLIGNDRISSLKVGAECPQGVYLCTDFNYAGTCEFFRVEYIGGRMIGGDVSLGAGNTVQSDTASSLHIEIIPPPGSGAQVYVRLCADVALKNCGWTSASVPDLRQMKAGVGDGKPLNDRVSSLWFEAYLPAQ